MTWTSVLVAQRACQRPMCIGTERSQTHSLCI